MYNYRDSKSNIINILKSKTPIEKKDKISADHEFTYDNGIRCFTSAIFVDIKNSTELFKNQDEKLARLLRAFTSEIITIFQDFDKYNQIGIRGDCVYAIYSTPKQHDVCEVFRIAIKVNTFMKMFNQLLKDFKYPNIGVGIGLGCSEELIIKAGRTGTGINDKIWIGDAVVDAANLSSIANRNDCDKIVMSSDFYYKIRESEYKNKDYFRKISCQNEDYGGLYECNVVNSDFDNWIKRGMKDVDWRKSKNKYANYKRANR